jgi:nucleotide-binding universal stress UspA family protein
MAIERYTNFDQTQVDRLRKFVVVVDDTPECRIAMRFAAGRAAHSLGGRVLLLHVIRPPDFVQWGAVSSVMEEESHQAATELLEGMAREMQALCGLIPELRIESGKTTDVVLALLKSDPDVFGLVLAASAQGEPGPLVEFFSRRAVGQLPCPLVIVPGSMSEAQLDALV